MFFVKSKFKMKLKLKKAEQGTKPPNSAIIKYHKLKHKKNIFQSSILVESFSWLRQNYQRLIYKHKLLKKDWKHQKQHYDPRQIYVHLQA